MDNDRSLDENGILQLDLNPVVVDKQYGIIVEQVNEKIRQIYRDGLEQLESENKRLRAELERLKRVVGEVDLGE